MKPLIALALDASHGSVQGVASIANRAGSVGAADFEIAEALSLAYLASGNSILMASSATISNGRLSISRHNCSADSPALLP